MKQFAAPSAKTLWTARNAWPCVAVLLISQLLVDVWIEGAQRHTLVTNWLGNHEYLFHNALGLLRAVFWVLVAFLFSDLTSAREFFKCAGLNRPPDLKGWLYAWVAVGLALLDRYCRMMDLNLTSHITYARSGEPLLFAILLPTLVDPFWEEVVGRGFLYRAFRGSYGIFLSILLVLGFQANFHWVAIIHSLVATVFLFGLWILLCLVREHTGSVWNCVLCHGAYNSAQVLSWPVYTITIIFLLLVCRNRGEL